MKCPEEKICYGVICEKFPRPSVYFATFDGAVRWAKSNQPAYRPYYIVECVEHYEICGSVDDKKETKEMKDENKTYEQGLADAWEAARKIVADKKDGGITSDVLYEIFCASFTDEIILKNTASEAIAKIKAYEEEQTEIKVGDEVIEFDEGNVITGIVTSISPLPDDSNLCYILWLDGSTYSMRNTELKKTGRHFPQVEELLKAMKKRS